MRRFFEARRAPPASSLCRFASRQPTGIRDSRQQRAEHPVDAQSKLVGQPNGRHSLGAGRRARLDHGQNPLAGSSPRQAESHNDAIPMFQKQVEVAHDGGIFRQNANRPAGLVQNGLQAPPPQVVLLRARTPRIDGGAQLNHSPLPPAGCVPGDLFGDVRVNDAVAVLERAFPGLFETDVATQQGAAGAVGAAMPALEANVGRELSQFLPGKFRRWPNPVTERIWMDSQGLNHHLSLVFLLSLGRAIVDAEADFYAIGTAFASQVASHAHAPGNLPTGSGGTVHQVGRPREMPVVQTVSW